MLFQTDYWRLDDAALDAIARRFNVSAAVAGEHAHYDRKYAIDSLLARDSAMRTGVSVISTLASLLLTVINIGIFIASRL